MALTLYSFNLADVNKAPPTVFISYNWGVQEEVRALRDFLERSGYPCWMDIGQMGGGDVLYNKIYEGIHHAKVRLRYCQLTFLFLRLSPSGLDTANYDPLACLPRLTSLWDYPKAIRWCKISLKCNHCKLWLAYITTHIWDKFKAQLLVHAALPWPATSGEPGRDWCMHYVRYSSGRQHACACSSWGSSAKEWAWIEGLLSDGSLKGWSH